MVTNVLWEPAVPTFTVQGATDSTKTSVPNYQNTRRRTSEYCNMFILKTKTEIPKTILCVKFTVTLRLTTRYV
jgi:hypothetical protein